MRNLKRALSLALASVMLLGMMVVGTSASYSDVDASDNVEAIEVAQALGLMVGTDGKFNPDGTVTRQELAGIITKLLKLNPDSYAGVSHFTDVDPNEWYAPFIEAVYSNGIMAGVGDGKFDRTSTVPAWQIGTAICKALGYFQTPGDYGDDAIMAGTRQARKAGLLDGLEGNNHLAPLTRNEIALVCLNALQATMVDMDQNTGVTVEGNGVTVTVGGATYLDRTTTNTKYASFKPADPGEKETIELGEDVYGATLKKDEAADALGRTANVWEYQGEEIGRYAKAATYTYVVSKVDTTANTLDNYVDKVLKKTGWEPKNTSASSGTNLIVVVNGADEAEYSTATYPAIGSTVEFYMNENDANQIDKVVIIEPKVVTLTGDAETKVVDGKTQVKVPGVSNLTAFSSDYTTENVFGFEGLKKDDVVLVVSGGYGDADDTIYITKAESFTGKATSMKNGSELVVNGTARKQSGLSGTNYSAAGFSDYKNEYTFYFDASGAIVKAKQITEEASKDYAYVLETSYDKGETHLTDTAVGQARLLFMDGTSQVVSVSKVDDKDSVDDLDTALKSSGGSLAKKFVTYKVVDGAYELTTAESEGTAGGKTTGSSITAKAVKFDGTNVGNSSTIFLVNTQETDTNKKPTITIYTGVASLPGISSISNGKAVIKDGVAKYVYFEAASSAISGSSGEYIYIPGTGNSHTDWTYRYVPESSSGAGDDGYEMTAIVDGVSQTVKFAKNPKTTGNNLVDTAHDGTGDADLNINKVYKIVKRDSKDRITLVSNENLTTPETGVEYNDGLIVTKLEEESKNYYKVTDETKVYFIDLGKGVSEIAPENITKDNTAEVYVVEKDTDASGDTAKKVFIVETLGTSTEVISIKYSVNGVEVADPDTSVAGAVSETSASQAKKITLTTEDKENAVIVITEVKLKADATWSATNGKVQASPGDTTVTEGTTVKITITPENDGESHELAINFIAKS